MRIRLNITSLYFETYLGEKQLFGREAGDVGRKLVVHTRMKHQGDGKWLVVHRQVVFVLYLAPHNIQRMKMFLLEILEECRDAFIGIDPRCSHQDVCSAVWRGHCIPNVITTFTTGSSEDKDDTNTSDVRCRLVLSMHMFEIY